jgi:hypothetical protein
MRSREHLVNFSDEEKMHIQYFADLRKISFDYAISELLTKAIDRLRREQLLARGTNVQPIRER